MLILLIKNDPVVAQSRSGGSPGEVAPGSRSRLRWTIIDTTGRRVCGSQDGICHENA